MASAKKDIVTAPQNEFTIDWNAILPQGVSKEDLRKTGALTPIYSPGEAFAGKWKAIMVYLVGIETLPTQNVGTPFEFTPQMIRAVLRTAGKGMQGVGESKAAVDLVPGDDILIPITGSLKVNREIMLAATDPVRLFTAGFAVIRQEKVNEAPSPMWVWEAPIVGQFEERKGRYLQMGQPVQILGKTGDGTVYNKSTGEVGSAGGARS